MATRSIRPRVLSAIHQLGTFTISELCQVAGLRDRNQAYTQLKRLADHGFLEDRPRPSEGKAHAPLKEYSLLRDAETQKRFAEELALYRPPAYALPESDMAKVSLEEAARTLDRIDLTLNQVEQNGEDQAEYFPSLENEFGTVETNLEVARLEFSGATAKGQTSDLKRLNDRLDKTRTKYAALKEKTENELSFSGFAPLLQTAASYVASNATKELTKQMGGLRKLVSPDLSNYRAAFEVLLDEIMANKEYPFEPIFRRAVLSRDSNVVYDIVQRLSTIDAPWWDFTRENAWFLKTTKLNPQRWLKAFEKVSAQMPARDKVRFVVYSYEADKMTEEVYLGLTKEKRLSLVTPHAVGFLGTAEIIKPTLGIENRNIVNSLDCSFLDPEESFHAYGPIANDVMLWQGAPRLRVAACLGMWGLPLKSHLRKILDSLEEERGLLIVQGEVDRIPKATSHILHAEEIGEHVSG